MITKKEVAHIAKLARLGLSEKEKDKFAQDLSSVLDYVKKLSSLDTEGVPPLDGGTFLESVFRDDGDQDLADEKMKKDILEAAPDREGGFFRVPSILE